MSKFKILYNPASQGGRSKRKVGDIKSYMSELGVDFVIEETKGPKIGIDQAASAKGEGFTTVVAMGGDGTVHEVGNGAIKEGLQFAVIPIGSGNDFASGIGLKGWKDGIDSLISDNVQKLSYLKIGDHYSINILDTGLGADVVKLSENHLKWISGSLKYTLLTLRQNFKNRRYDVSINIDGETTNHDLNMLACGFGQTFGSGMNILPYARYNQEEMQICIIENASRSTVMRIMPKVFKAGHVKYPKYVTMLTGKKISVSLNEERVMYLEGEGEIFSMVPFEAEVVSKGLSVHLPEGWDLNNRTIKLS